MNTPKTLIPLIIAVLGGAIAFGFLVGKPEPQKRERAQAGPLQVEVATLQAQTRSISLLSQGSLQAKQRIELSSEVSGRIIEVMPAFADGAFFKSGAALLRIDPSDYEIALVKARAQRANAEQNLAQERGRARQAKREWRNLGDANANALFLRKPQLAAAEAQLAAAKADVKKAEQDLADTTLRAPFDGRIERTRVNLGQMLSSASAAATIYASDRAEVRLPLNEQQQALLTLPLREAVAVTLRNSRGVSRDALIRRSDASLDERTRLLYLIAELDDPMGLNSDSSPLTIGDFLHAEINSKTIANVLRIPRIALRGQNEIWLAEQGQLRIETVDVLQIEDDYISIALQQTHNSPLQLVLTPLSGARDGLAISVLENTAPANEAAATNEVPNEATNKATPVTLDEASTATSSNVEAAQ